MTSMYDVEPSELVEKTSEELKKLQELKPVAWAVFVKTGTHKERPPVKSDWWYARAASILRSVALLGPVGVSKLRTKYGGKKNRGYRPEHFFKGSGSIIRKILQQLEKAGLIVKAEKGVHKGRVITPKGISLLNSVASKIKGSKPKKSEQPEPTETVIIPEKRPDKASKREDKTLEKLDKIEDKKEKKVKKLVKKDVSLVKEKEKLEKEIVKEEAAIQNIAEEKEKIDAGKNG